MALSQTTVAAALHLEIHGKSPLAILHSQINADASLKNISDLQITKTSGTAKIKGYTCCQSGKNILMQLTLENSKEVLPGNNAFEGQLSNYKPAVSTIGCGYIGMSLLLVLIDTNGFITVRVLASSFGTESAAVSVGYICS